MPYQQVQYSHITDDFLREEVFRRADMLLGDVHTMLAIEVPAGTNSCGWAGALVLICVIDGISQNVFPTKYVELKQRKRFKQFIDKVGWTSAPGWVSADIAAKLLYFEVRNSLVHDLAGEPQKRIRPARFSETAIGKWGMIPEAERNFGAINASRVWPEFWPMLGVESVNGVERYSLSAVGLYWHVSHWVQKLARDDVALNEAIRLRSLALLKAGWRKYICRLIGC